MKPIIFSTEMVKAILKEQKTQTRRVIKDGANRTPQNIGREKFYKMVNALNNKSFFGAGFYKDSDVFECKGEILTDAVYFKCPYKPGDVLYVKETWGKDENGEYVYRTNYGTTENDSFPPSMFKWKPSIHMPREAARIFLKVTNVRVERLQDITEEDAIAEGISWLDEACYSNNGWTPTLYDPDSGGSPVFRDGFAALWDNLNAKRGYSWESNPWVWVYEFERISKDEAESEGLK